MSIFAVKREDFINIIQKNSMDYEQFCMIKDSQIFNKDDQNFVSKKCSSCSSADHQTLACNLLQYVPDKEKIIKQYDFSHFQERNQAFRRTLKRNKNSLIFRKPIIIKACKIQKDIKKSRSIFDSTNSFNLSFDEISHESSSSSENNSQSEEGTFQKKKNFALIK